MPDLCMVPISFWHAGAAEAVDLPVQAAGLAGGRPVDGHLGRGARPETERGLMLETVLTEHRR